MHRPHVRVRRFAGVEREPDRADRGVHADGSCTGTATTTHSWAYAYDGADRQTTAAKDGAAAVGSYTYDAFGRQTLLPAADAPDPTKGDVTLGYSDTDLPAWVQQNNTRTTYTLDLASHRLVSTTGPNGGTATSTTTRHYIDASDIPAWVDVDNDAAGPNPAVTTRFAESLGEDLGVQIASDGAAELTLATLHGDTATAVTLTAAQGESTSCTGINGWSDYTEYGQSLAGASTDTVDGPVGYGWLGAQQRSTTLESAGLTLMGDRYYNNVTGPTTMLPADSPPPTPNSAATSTPTPTPSTPPTPTTLNGHSRKPSVYEVFFCADHPGTCVRFYVLSRWADGLANKTFPHHGKGNPNDRWQGFRHQIWSAAMYIEFGFKLAKEYADVHERGRPNDSDHKRDLGNNAKGRELGRRWLRRSWWYTSTHDYKDFIITIAKTNIQNGVYNRCHIDPSIPNDNCGG